MQILTSQRQCCNSRGNARATARLLGRDITAAEHDVRYLPDTDESENTIRFDMWGVVAHSGPPRDTTMLKDNLPKNAGWLTLNLDDVVDAQVTMTMTTKMRKTRPPQRDGIQGTGKDNSEAMEAPTGAGSRQPHTLSMRSMRRNEEARSPNGGALATERCPNRPSTKPSFPRISHIGGVRLLFPGDAQYGAWESVRSDRESLDLISNVDF
jgi:hypothetical protein